MLVARRFAIGLGIAVALPVLIYLCVSMIWKPPSYTDYHNYKGFTFSTPARFTKYTSTAAWTKDEAAYDKAQMFFEKRLFAFAVPLGLAALIIGSMITGSPVGPGLMFGGIFSVIDGFGVGWDKVPDVVRFISLVVLFGILLYVGLHKNLHMRTTPNDEPTRAC